MTGPLLDDFNMAASRLGEYLAVWANPDWEKGEHSKEFTAFMLLKARGEAERCARALLAGHPDGGRDLQRISLELDRMFRSNLSTERLVELRDVIVECLDCQTLTCDLSDYLALSDQYLSSEDDETRRELLFEVTEEGSNLLIRRDELQTVVDQIAALGSLPAMSESQLQTMESHRADLQKFDSTMKESLWAFKPLLRSLKAFRESYSDHAFDRKTYWWWFLDLSAAEAVGSRQELANKLGVILREGDRSKWKASLLVDVGKLLYLQLMWNTDLGARDRLATFAHGALMQGLILSKWNGYGPQHAQTCYLLALVCRSAARWTQDVSSAERSLRLLDMAYEHAEQVEQLVSAGFPKFTRNDGEILLRGLKAGAGPRFDLPPGLDPQALLWLRSNYGVSPEGELRRRMATALQNLKSTSMSPRLRLATQQAGGAGDLRVREDEGEELENLPPGIEAFLFWPATAGRQRVSLVFGKLNTPIRIWANLPPPKGIEWADWVARGKCDLDDKKEVIVRKRGKEVEVRLTQVCHSVDASQRQIIREWVSRHITVEQLGEDG